jgi:hypothetical protein
MASSSFGPLRPLLQVAHQRVQDGLGRHCVTLGCQMQRVVIRADAYPPASRCDKIGREIEGRQAMACRGLIDLAVHCAQGGMLERGKEREKTDHRRPGRGKLGEGVFHPLERPRIFVNCRKVSDALAGLEGLVLRIVVPGCFAAALSRFASMRPSQSQ